MNVGVWYLILTIWRADALALREVGPFSNERACMTAAQLWLQTPLAASSDSTFKPVLTPARSAICAYSGAPK